MSIPFKNIEDGEFYLEPHVEIEEEAPPEEGCEFYFESLEDSESDGEIQEAPDKGSEFYFEPMENSDEEIEEAPHEANTHELQYNIKQQKDPAPITEETQLIIKHEPEVVKHTGDKPYSCQICGALFRDKYGVKRHMNTHANTKPFKYLDLEVDSVKGETEENYKEPGSQNVENGRGKGHKKSKRVITQFSEEDEKAVNLLIQVDETGIYICGSPGCSTKARLRNTMKRHIRVHHLNLIKYQCKECDYTTKFLQALNAHTSAIHEKVSHHCQFCNFKAAYKTNVQKHIKIVHENASKLQCPWCEFQSAKKFLLDHHIEGMHVRKPLHCDQCSFVTTWKNTFKRHVLRYHKKQEKKLKCELCEYSSVFPYEMKSHVYFKHGAGTTLILKKNESGVYACDQCEYSSVKMCNVKLHIFSKHVSNLCE